MRVATDQTVWLESFVADVSWLGPRRPVYVVQTQSEILMGTYLFWNSQLTVQFWEGGSVSVQSRPE